MFNQQNWNLQAETYLFLPIIDEKTYNSCMNSFFMNFQTNNAFLYGNDYQHFNESSHIDYQNCNQINENKSPINLVSNRNIQMENQSSEQYFPEIKMEIRRKNAKRQNVRRNTSSSLINQVLTFLNKSNKSGILVQKILELKKIKSKQFLRQYYEYQFALRRRLPRYTGMKIFIDNLIVKKQDVEPSEYNKKLLYVQITRRLVAYYLKNKSVQVVINSKKILPINKKYHFQQIREVLKELKSIGNTENQKI